MSNHHPSGIPTLDDIKIAVIGLGYVGLPLARLFSTRYPTIGYDLDKHRVDALMQGHDTTLEVEDDMLQKALDAGFRCTSSIEEIRNATAEELSRRAQLPLSVGEEIYAFFRKGKEKETVVSASKL